MASDSERRFEILSAVLIALSSLIGAFVAWRAFAAGNAAGDADFAGLSAMLAAEEARANNAVNAYESYGAYVDYKRYRTLAASLQEARDALPESAALEAAKLEAQRDLAQTAGAIAQQRFSRRYVKRDGTYDLDGQLATLYADRARQRDLNAAPSFTQADRLREKVSWLQGTSIPLALSLVFFTLAEAFKARWRRLALIVGVLLLAGGTLAFLYFELSIR